MQISKFQVKVYQYQYISIATISNIYHQWYSIYLIILNIPNAGMYLYQNLIKIVKSEKVKQQVKVSILQYLNPYIFTYIKRHK